MASSGSSTAAARATPCPSTTAGERCSRTAATVDARGAFRPHPAGRCAPTWMRRDGSTYNVVDADGSNVQAHVSAVGASKIVAPSLPLSLLDVPREVSERYGFRRNRI